MHRRCTKQFNNAAERQTAEATQSPNVVQGIYETPHFPITKTREMLLLQQHNGTEDHRVFQRQLAANAFDKEHEHFFHSDRIGRSLVPSEMCQDKL